MSDITLDLTQAPKRNIEFLKGKGQKITFNHDEMSHEQHLKAFTVAKAMRNDIVNDIHESLIESMESGRGFDDWKRNIKPTLAEYGWYGKTEVKDPRTGEIKEIDVNPHRLKNIYRTNINTAYAKGRYDEMMENEYAVYWRFVTFGDEGVRDKHAEWHNVVRHRDDPWWETHYPLKAGEGWWGCRCDVEECTLKEALRNGWNVYIWHGDEEKRKNPFDTSEIAGLEKMNIDDSVNDFPVANKKDDYKNLTDAEVAKKFTDTLGVKDGEPFIDVVGDPLVVNDRMLKDCMGQSKLNKGNRAVFVEEFAKTIKDPDEVYLEWEKIKNPALQGNYPKDGYRLKKRMVKYYQSEDGGEPRMINAVFAYEKDKTQGITALYRKVDDKKLEGKLIYSKKRQ
jgi:hypothetical protein